MGAWGTGYFDDDAALDFIDDIEESSSPKEIIKAVLNNALQNRYIESDDGTAVVICGLYIDSQVNGTKYSSGHDFVEVDSFSSRNPSIDLSDLKNIVVPALKKILSDQSELNELWEENEEDYPAWKNNIVNLLQRLSK